MSNMLIERINQRLKTLGKSAQRVSSDATGAKETLRKILDGTTKNPRIDTLQKIAAELDTSVEWLTGKENVEAESFSTHSTNSGPPERNAPPLPSRMTMALDVPVMGTVAGSVTRGAFQLEGGIVDYVRRPPTLTGARDIYALFVEGTSMEPQFFSGDLIYINPHRPARPGDIVVVQCKNGEFDGEESSLGIFKRKSAEGLIIIKRNPADTEIVFKLDRVISIHKVLSTNELFGV